MIEVYEIQKPGLTNSDVPAFWKFANSKNCIHSFVVGKLEASNGTIQYRRICDICGAVTGYKGNYNGTAIPHAALTYEEKTNAIDYRRRDAIKAEYKARLHEEYEALFGVEEGQARYRVKFWEWYSVYLSSLIWQRRRQAVMRRARGICEACQVASATEVHHLTYAHVGREPLFELVAVCTKCHEQITGWDRP